MRVVMKNEFTAMNVNAWTKHPSKVDFHQQRGHKQALESENKNIRAGSSAPNLK